MIPAPRWQYRHLSPLPDALGACLSVVGVWTLGLVLPGCMTVRGGDKGTPPEKPPMSQDALHDLAMERLAAGGLEGEVHGVQAAHKAIVLTVRAPDSFFVYRHYPMVADNAAVAKALEALRRHDRIKVNGALSSRPQNPQPHIAVSRIEIVKPWEGGPPARVPGESNPSPSLPPRGRLIAKVHALGGNGSILVIEHGRLIRPVPVKAPGFTKSLYRNDIVEIDYIVREKPPQPAHLLLDESVKAPIRSLDRVADIHGKPVTLQGTLVRFPKSPQVKFDVYALEISAPHGFTRDHTLVNFNDSKAFDAIRTKLASIWNADGRLEEFIDNRYVKRGLVVQATGTGNVQTPDQANPQILLENADAIRSVSL